MSDDALQKLVSRLVEVGGELGGEDADTTAEPQVCFATTNADTRVLGLVPRYCCSSPVRNRTAALLPHHSNGCATRGTGVS